MTDKASQPKDGSKARQTRQKRLGRQLRKLYDDVAEEPVPDDFLKLLENADKARGND